jgi:sulfatase maturation enzyme AslB (radical SAM superfamily)
MYGDKKKVEIIKNINSKDIENINKLDHIEFIGGETLKSASLWDYLKKLDKNTSFSLQTNGTVILLKDQIDLLKSFSNFNICFSIDGYDNIFEYIRQPASWKDVQKNICIYKEHFGINKLSYYLTINNLNIFYIDKIVFNLYKILPTNIDLNFVFDPSELSYNNLTKNIGSIVENNNPAFFKNFNIQWVGNKETIKKLFDNLKKQDEYSGKKFQDYLPELYELLIK